MFASIYAIISPVHRGAEHAIGYGGEQDYPSLEAAQAIYIKSFLSQANKIHYVDAMTAAEVRRSSGIFNSGPHMFLLHAVTF